MGFLLFLNQPNPRDQLVEGELCRRKIGKEWERGEKKTGERKGKQIRSRQMRVQMNAFFALLGVVRIVQFYVSQ